MSFNPNKVKQFDLEGEDSWMSEHPNGSYVRASDFDETRERWEERGKEIERLVKALVSVADLVEEWIQ